MGGRGGGELDTHGISLKKKKSNNKYGSTLHDSISLEKSEQLTLKTFSVRKRSVVDLMPNEYSYLPLYVGHTVTAFFQSELESA